MAPPPGTLRVGRYFLALIVLLAVLYGIVFLPGQRHTPKLGIDLIGGTQVTFIAKAPHGKTPSSSAMDQAKDIMTDRVNGTGVTQSTVVIVDPDELIVSIPGHQSSDIQKLGAAAKLNFRGLVAAAVPVGCSPTGAATSPTGSTSPSPGASSSGHASTSPSPSATGTGSQAPNDAGHHALAPSPTKSSTKSGSTATSKPAASSTPTSSPTGSGSTTPAAPPKCSLHSVAQLKKAVKLPAPSSVYAAGGLSDTVAQSVAAQLTNYDCADAQNAPDPVNDYYIACDDGKTYGAVVAYLLGPVVVPGTQVDTAAAQAPNGTTVTEWSVQLTLKGAGSSAWAKYTGAHNIGSQNSSNLPAATSCASASTPCADFVGFTLDGQVISAPVNESAINGQATQITGNFNSTSANDLAQKLKYGALPLSFSPQAPEEVSATLGSAQLKAGLLAGGIGLILVVLYSLIYYRALGLVTIASLVVSGGLTYALLVILGTQIGFTLSLAGIAGFIVAVGITADSFVVFFERIKDEVHEGRSMRVAVPRAWVRARRTILSADTVSFLAAVILYWRAAGDVRGFAFTLGLSTILDLVVVFLFTHPMISALSRSRAFGSARFTGLNAVRVGGVNLPDELPPRRRGGARSARAADAGRPARSSAPVAVLDAADDESSGVGAPVADDPTGVDDAADGGAEDRLDESQPRRRTTPEPGTAAERAAARRARLRDEGSGKDER